MVRNTADNRFGPPTFIVDADASLGSHTTIQSAIDDAVAGNTIHVHPGTYTEDLTLIDGISIAGFPGTENTGKTLIVGKITQTVAGAASLMNLRLQTNSDVILNITGANAVQTQFRDCVFLVNDGDCITVNNVNASPYFDKCFFNQNTNTLDFWNITTCGIMKFVDCWFFNAGVTAGVSTIAAGRIEINHCFIGNHTFTTSASGNYFMMNTLFDSNTNTTYLTTAGTGISELKYVYMDAGTATAITVGAGTTVKARYVSIDTSSGTPVSITGTFDTTYNAY